MKNLTQKNYYIGSMQMVTIVTRFQTESGIGQIYIQTILCNTCELSHTYFTKNKWFYYLIKETLRSIMLRNKLHWNLRLVYRRSSCYFTRLYKICRIWCLLENKQRSVPLSWHWLYLSSWVRYYLFVSVCLTLNKYPTYSMFFTCYS
jgi:hypothetical protein